MAFAVMIPVLLISYPFQAELANAQACTTDRINSLLYNGSRVGFGADTTGGASASKFTVVTNTNDRGSGSLREAVTRSGSKWVIFDDSLRGKTITLNTPIKDHNGNLTIDGRGSDGRMNNITISPKANEAFPMLQLRGGNAIIYGVTLDGNATAGTALMARQGNDYWFDQLTITQWFGDDAIAIGQGSEEDSADKITISNYHAYNTTDAVQAGGNDNYPNFPLHRGTLFNSHLNADDRNPRITYGGNWHMFNNYVHGFKYGGVDINNASQMIAESNVIYDNKSYENKSESGRGSSSFVTRSTPNGPMGYIYTDNKNIFIGDARPKGNIDLSTPSPFKIPYSYNKMDASQVVNYVNSNAGAQNASADLTYCPDGSNTG